jgi:hypothetical protein
VSRKSEAIGELFIWENTEKYKEEKIVANRVFQIPSLGIFP